jgi:malate synthase
VGEDFELQIQKSDILKSVRVCLIYYFHWFKGTGAVAFDNLMEDASTVEICRTQLWVWLNQRARIMDKEIFLDSETLIKYIEKEGSKISTHDKLTLMQAKGLLKHLLKQAQMNESFLELAYPLLD